MVTLSGGKVEQLNSGMMEYSRTWDRGVWGVLGYGRYSS